MKILRAGLLATVMSIASAYGFKAADDKASMPDFCQKNEALPNNGLTYCGPVAASNVLVHLDRIGFPNMIQGDNIANKEQLELIKLLGSDRYMRTSPSRGTEPIDLIRGLERYITDRGYKVSIKWAGEGGGKYTVSTKQPDPSWLKKEIENGSQAVLLVGFYEKHEGGITLYLRNFSHYITMNNFRDHDVISVHDPSPPLDKEPKNDVYKLVPLQKGFIGSSYGGSVRPTNGYLALKNASVKNKLAAIVLEGALVFKIEDLKQKSKDENPNHNKN